MAMQVDADMNNYHLFGSRGGDSSTNRMILIITVIGLRSADASFSQKKRNDEIPNLCIGRSFAHYVSTTYNVLTHCCY